MASTYSTNLAIELPGTGDQAGTWGNTTNTNLGTLIEQAISGYVTQAVATGTDTTITIPNGATGVARNMYIELTGTGGASTNLIVPANKKLYFIFNNSTGAVTVKVSGQTGVSVPQGKKVVLTSNGTDVVNGLNYIADFASNSATITHLTATSATITNLTLTSLVISNLSIASANITTLTSASATITNLLATTLTTSSTVTLNGGTANGVLYLNGSKVATSGSALTFDGTNFATTGTASATKFIPTGGTATGNGMYLPAANTVAFSTNGVRRVDFDPYGNVLVGGTADLSPAVNSVGVSINNPLTSSNGGSVLAFGAQGSRTGYVSADASSNVEVNSTSGYTQLSTSGGTARLTAAGVLTLSNNPTFSGGTANGVLFLNGSKVATSGSALTFDGTTLNAAGSTRSFRATADSGTAYASLFSDGVYAFGTDLYLSAPASKFIAFFANATEQMRLTSTGLGIGTVSPGGKFNVDFGNFVGVGARFQFNSSNIPLCINALNNSGDAYISWNAAAKSGSNTSTYVITSGATKIEGGGSQLIFYNAPSGTAGTDITFTERMRLDSSGNLGIGTSSPAGILNIKTSNGQLLVQNGTSANQMRISALNNAGNANAALIFEGYSSEYGRFDSSGNLGIGTTSPAEKLTVNGGIGLQRSGTQYWHYAVNASNALVFTRSSVADRLTLDSDGNLGLGVTPSASGAGITLFQGGSFFVVAGGGNTILSNNAVNNSGYKYINTDTAGRYQISGNEHQWYTAPSGTAGNAITFTQAMTLDASGNLGVGETSPASRLHVSGTSNSVDVFARIQQKGNNTAAGLVLSANDNTGAGYNFIVSETTGGTQHWKISGGVATSTMAFFTGGTERARILSDGKIAVNRTTAFSASMFSADFDGINANGAGFNDTASAGGSAFIQFGTGGTVRGNITNNNNTGVLYNQTSDERLKKNISDAGDFGDVIDAIKVRKFDWKLNDLHNRAGFIAQELVTVAPEAVYQPNNEEDMMGVDYSKLVPMLVKEIQSLRKRVAELETK